MGTDLECFEHIINQSKELCIKAIRIDPYVIEAMINPTEELCLAAVKKNGDTIRFIKDPTKAVCIAAVTHCSHDVLDYISNPSEKILAAAKRFTEIRQQKAKYYDWDMN